MTVSMMWIYLEIFIENYSRTSYIFLNLPICALNVGSDNPPTYAVTVCFQGVPAGFQPANVVFVVGAELILLQPRELERPGLRGNRLTRLLPAFLHQLLYREFSLEDDQMSE